MVIYEVTAMVRADLEETYQRFMLERHIQDLIATENFSSVTFARSKPGRYRVLYYARSREALDKYLSEDARRLREDFMTHFPSGIEISREEWIVIRHFA